MSSSHKEIIRAGNEIIELIGNPHLGRFLATLKPTSI